MTRPSFSAKKEKMVLDSLGGNFSLLSRLEGNFDRHAKYTSKKIKIQGVTSNLPLLKIGIQGFTLLELLVALTVFTIMAMMAYGGFNTIITAYLQTKQHATQLAHLQTTLSWLKRDLEQFVNRPIRDQYGDKQGALYGTNTQVELTRTGWRNLTQQSRSSLQRVAYHLDDKTLVRSYWWALDRAQDASPIQMNLLNNVTHLQFRYLDTNLQWLEQWSFFEQTRLEKNNQEQHVIKAIEVTLTVSGWGELIRLFSINGK